MIKSVRSIVLDIYFIIKARQSNLDDLISSYFMIFTLNPIYGMSQNILCQQNIFIFDLLLQQHLHSQRLLFMLSIIVYQI